MTMVFRGLDKDTDGTIGSSITKFKTFKWVTFFVDDWITFI